MPAIDKLNLFAESWVQFMLAALTDASILLVFLCLAWFFLRHRFSAQFGYCLFLLVLVRVVVPWQFTLPEWCNFVPQTYAVADLFESAGTPPHTSATPECRRR